MRYLAVILVLCVITAVVTSKYVFNFGNLNWIENLIVLGGFLAIFGCITVVMAIFWSAKKFEKIEKGKVLIEMEYKPLEALPKYFKYAYTFIFGVLIFVIVVNALFGNYAYVLFPSVVLLSNLIIVLTKVRLTVYERGIRFGLTFVEWCDVKGIEWRNGILSIRTKSRTIRIVDKNRKIYETVRSLV
jgi:uncharacterized membrane protein YobD (UPF0266 family)